MKLVINEKLIKRNKLIGQITTFASLAILALGLVLAFKKDTTRILLSYVALVVGFIVSQVGITYTNRFGRSPRFDELLAKSFEKLGSEYTLYVYSSPVPILLLGPCGIWIPIPILSAGKVTYEKGKWKQQGGSFLMKAFAQEGIGKPEVEELNAIKEIHKLLSSKNVPESQFPGIQTILVLLNEKTEIGDVSNAPSEIVHLRKLKLHIRQYDRNCTSPLSEEQLNQLNQFLLKE